MPETDLQQGNVRERIAKVEERLKSTPTSDDFYEFSEKVFARIAVEISTAFKAQDDLEAERRKVWGHETAKVIAGAIDTVRDDLKGRIRRVRDDLSSHIEQGHVKGSTDPSDFTKRVAWVAVAGVMAGALFSQYVIPFVVRFVVLKMTGG